MFLIAPFCPCTSERTDVPNLVIYHGDDDDENGQTPTVDSSIFVLPKYNIE
jgi:hypothetical protein